MAMVSLGTVPPVDGLWYEDILQLANESRDVVAPARRYCDGVASVTNQELYETPHCTASTTQTPMINKSAVNVELIQLHNLSFCCKSNYTTVLPAGTNVTAKDEEARFLYEQAVTGSLRRFDCASFYPFRTCAPCAYAYRSWICALVFPLGCAVGSSSDAAVDVAPAQAVPICRDVCLEVMRKCPSTLSFRCPTSSQYSVPRSPDAFSNKSSFASIGCNAMHYDRGAIDVPVTVGATSPAHGTRTGGAWACLIAVWIAMLLFSAPAV